MGFFQEKCKNMYWCIFLWSASTLHRAECLPFTRMNLITPLSQRAVISAWSESKRVLVFYYSQRTLQTAAGTWTYLQPVSFWLKAATYPFALVVTLLELVLCPMSFCSLHPSSCSTEETHSVQVPCLCVLSYHCFPRITSDLPMLSSSSVLFIHIYWYSCVPGSIIRLCVLIRMSGTALVPLI